MSGSCSAIRVSVISLLSTKTKATVN